MVLRGYLISVFLLFTIPHDLYASHPDTSSSPKRPIRLDLRAIPSEVLADRLFGLVRENTLDLSCSFIDDEHMSLLVEHRLSSSIVTLNLSESIISQKSFMALNGLHNLGKLYLKSCHITNRELYCLSNLAHLQILNLSNCQQLTQGLTKDLRDSIGHLKVRGLKLESLSAQCVLDLQYLSSTKSHFKELSHLSISFSSIYLPSFTMWMCPQLESLFIRKVNFVEAPKDYQALDPHYVHSYKTSFYTLRYVGLNYGTLKKLIIYEKLKNDREMHLLTAQFSCDRISQFLHEKLIADIINEQMSRATMDPKAPPVKTFSVNFIEDYVNDPDRSNIFPIEQITRFNYLVQLDLSKLGLHDADLNVLEHLDKLERLYLYDNQLTSQCFQYIQKESLKVLDVSANPISDLPAVAISGPDVIKDPKDFSYLRSKLLPANLEELTLSGTQIKGRCITGILNKTKILRLFINANQLSTKYLRCLQEAQREFIIFIDPGMVQKITGNRFVQIKPCGRE